MLLVDNMFQNKTDEIFEDLPNIFGIADDILTVGYDETIQGSTNCSTNCIFDSAS